MARKALIVKQQKPQNIKQENTIGAKFVADLMHI